MTNTHLSLSLSFALLAIVLAFAGCGSGDETAQASLTKAQYQKQSNIICNTNSSKRFEHAIKYVKDHPGAENVDMVEPVLIPALEEELGDLKALGVPSGFEEQIGSFLKEYEAGLEALKEAPDSAFSETTNPFEKANELGEKYELGDCSRHP